MTRVCFAPKLFTANGPATKQATATQSMPEPVLIAPSLGSSSVVAYPMGVVTVASPTEKKIAMSMKFRRHLATILLFASDNPSRFFVEASAESGSCKPEGGLCTIRLLDCCKANSKLQQYQLCSDDDTKSV